MIDQVVSSRVKAAACPEDLFGDRADQTTVATDYRMLVKLVHPDHFAGTPDQQRAHELFVKLTSLRTLALQKLAAGIYGDRAASAPATAPAVDLSVSVRGKRYHVTARAHQGDICDLYACEHDGQPMLFKIAQSASDNDLVENESKVLAHLYPAGQKNEGFYRYLPQPIDGFVLKGKSNRRVNVLPWYKEHVSLAELIRLYPGGLDIRDAVWMFKRLLAGLGFVHSLGVVHGAVLPPHVLVHPVDHGAKLVDWCYSVHGAGHVKAISAPYRALYAPEVLAKKQPTAATDIYMAAKCLVALVGGKGSLMPDAVPTPIRAFVAGCLLEAPSKRPDNAWQLHEEFDELLARVIGKRAYRTLDLKPRSAT